MEIHPDAYDDPEENEWVLPEIPSLDSVPDNTSTWGPWYLWRGPANPAQAPLSLAVTREITPPWRRGLGLVLRHRHQQAWAFGLWFRGPEPQILSKAPGEKNWRAVVKRSNKLGKASEKLHRNDTAADT
jgi:hypothetical protein